MTQFYSAEGQDSFVYQYIGNKLAGHFLEVGSAMPVINNNTYLFESRFQWKGILIENDPNFVVQLRAKRSNPVVSEDATTIDYSKLFQKFNVPKRLDYLSLDIDPPSGTLAVLERLPLKEYTFTCVTFEHDRYHFGNSVAKKSREIFQDHGYTMFKKDHECPAGPFEDWYIYEAN